MRVFNVQGVVELLRSEVARAGSQSEFARQSGLQRNLINRTLNGERLPTKGLCRALGLKWVLAAHVTPSDGESQLVIVSSRDFDRLLRERVYKAGGAAAWARLFGIDRSHLSSVLHKRRAADQRIIAALDLLEILVSAKEHGLSAGPEAASARAHARWKKSPALA